MTNINDGGPAFPGTTMVPMVRVNQDTGEERPCGSQEVKTSGMSLRDYFAAKAIQAIMACHFRMNYPDAAKEAYHYADAMLAERAK